MSLIHRNKNRIVEIDFLRGILILFMIVDHFFYDLFGILPDVFSDYLSKSYKLYELAINYWNWDVRVATRLFILALFFVLSGICCYFSKNNLKRGLVVFIVGLLISLGFYIFSKITNNDMYIVFGAISCFGTSILLYFLLRFLFDKLAPNHKDDFKWISLSLGLLIVALGLTFGVWNIKTRGPSYTYETSFKALLEIVLGIKQSSGADWLPLCPYFGFMLIGAFIGETIYKDKKSLLPSLPNRPNEISSSLTMLGYDVTILPIKGINKIVTFVGRHSLLFYLGHQVVLVLLLCLIFLLKGYKLNIRL